MSCGEERSLSRLEMPWNQGNFILNDGYTHCACGKNMDDRSIHVGAEKQAILCYSTGIGIFSVNFHLNALNANIATITDTKWDRLGREVRNLRATSRISLPSELNYAQYQKTSCKAYAEL